jgi:hypothetical protein
MVCIVPSRANISKFSRKMLLTMGDRELPIAMPEKKKNSNPQCYTPSSEPFGIHSD